MDQPDREDSIRAGKPEIPLGTVRAGFLDRSIEAAAVVSFLMQACGRLVVLYGKRGGGKSDLIREWVVPLLSQQQRVYYGACSPEPPRRVKGPDGEIDLDWSAAPKGIILVDDVDRFITLPERSKRAGMETILRSVRETHGDCTLALVVCDENLRDIFALRQFFPEITENLFEMPEVSIEEGLRRLAASEAGSGSPYEPAVLETLRNDLERFRSRSASPVLICLIHAELQRNREAMAAEAVNMDVHRNVGGLKGILARRARRKLDELRAEGGEAVAEAAQAILEEVAAGGAIIPDLKEVSTRLEVSEESVEKALAWLRGPGGFLSEPVANRTEIVPDQLMEVIEEQFALKQRDFRPAQRMLEEALRSWRELQSLLPRDGFESLHRMRKDLKTSPEEAKLMTHCALRIAEKGRSESAAYWLERIPERDDKVAVLLSALFDKTAGTRLLAARLLKGFDEPDVLHQLYRTALEDPDARIQGEAVSSLEGMQVEQYREPLEEEARDPASPFRQSAIRALRIFRDDRTAKVLEDLVSDSASSLGVREKAIEALGAMEYGGAARALAGIALNDKDEEDRRNAAEALASARSAQLAIEILSALRNDRPVIDKPSEPLRLRSVLQGPAKVLLAMLVFLLNLVVHGAALFALRRYRLAIAFFLAEAAAIVVLVAKSPAAGTEPTRVFVAAFCVWLGTLAGGILAATSVLLLRRARLEVRLLSFQGILGVGLFAATAAIVFVAPHGLAHMLVKRFRTGFAILGFELLGVLCLFFGGLDETYFQVFEITRLGRIYLWTGVLLFLVTWLWDVVGVGYQYLFFPRRVVARNRRAAVYERVLANPHVSKVVLSAAESEDRREASWAKSLIRRFRESLPPAVCVDLLKERRQKTPRFFVRALMRTRREETIRGIQGLWPGADRAMRSRLVSILAGDPSERSLEYLGKLWSSLGWWAKARYGLAVCRFRLRLIPVPLWLVVLMVGSLAVEATAVFIDWSKLPLRFIASPKAANQQPDLVVWTAWFLGEALPGKSGLKVPEALSRSLPRSSERRAQLGAVELLTELAGKDEKSAIAEKARKALSDSRQVLQRILSDPDASSDDKRKIIRALEVAGADWAVAVLERYTLSVFALPGFDRVDQRRTEKEEKARQDERSLGLEALGALGRVGTPAADGALGQLAGRLGPFDGATARGLASSYQRRAERLLSSKQPEKALGVIDEAIRVDPRFPDAHGTKGLIYLELKRPQLALESFAAATRIEPRYPWAHAMQAWILLDQGNYLRSSEFAQRTIKEDPNYAWSYTLLSEGYHRQGKDREAITHLKRLRAQYPDSPWPLQSQMYVYHEHLSAGDPSSYERNYELYLELMDKLRDKITEPEDAEAGFIEANLTTGRYQTVVDRGEKLLGTTQKINLRLPVSVIVYAACVLKEDFKSALVHLDRLEKLVRELPKDFEPNWSYAGSLNYVKTRNLARELKDPLVALVSAVSENPKAVPGKLIDDNRRALKTR